MKNNENLEQSSVIEKSELQEFILYFKQIAWNIKTISKDIKERICLYFTELNDMTDEDNNYIVEIWKWMDWNCKSETGEVILDLKEYICRKKLVKIWNEMKWDLEKLKLILSLKKLAVEDNDLLEVFNIIWTDSEKYNIIVELQKVEIYGYYLMNVWNSVNWDFKKLKVCLELKKSWVPENDLFQIWKWINFDLKKCSVIWEILKIKK